MPSELWLRPTEILHDTILPSENARDVSFMRGPDEERGFVDFMVISTIYALLIIEPGIPETTLRVGNGYEMKTSDVTRQKVHLQGTYDCQ